MNVFDGAPMVVGTVKGVRSFTVDDTGILLGPMQHTPWQAGDNTSECRAGRAPLIYIGGQVINIQAFLPPRAMRDNHSLATCACGFYAYHDGSDDYRTEATISAVVEGWGDVMRGTRGFRAEHARILALCIPSRSLLRPRPLVGDWFWTAWAALAVMNAGFGIAAVAAGRWVGWISIVGALATGLIAWDSAFKPFRKYTGFGAPTRKQLAAVRRNYPGIPIYSTFAEMVAACPPDRGRSADPDADQQLWGDAA